MLAHHEFQIGDRVIFRATKRSTRPTPRAKVVYPEPMGEGYCYEVEKYWLIQQVEEQQVVVRTRRGKTRVLNRDDPALRRAYWWERLLFRDRFPLLPLNDSEESSNAEHFDQSAS